MTFELLLQMFPIALMFSAPIILTALGGLFSERSGIVNIALEGIMMVGAFTGATVTVLLENITPAAAWYGLLAGLLAGVVVQHTPRGCEHQSQGRSGHIGHCAQHSRWWPYGVSLPDYLPSAKDKGLLQRHPKIKRAWSE